LMVSFLTKQLACEGDNLQQLLLIGGQLWEPLITVATELWRHILRLKFSWVSLPEFQK